jgi:DNA-directed RNA polymerase specialized sigma24 family protein
MTQLDRSLSLLPPQRARAFVLRYALGKDTAEICAEPDVSASNLAVILHRARQQPSASLHSQWAPQFAGDGLS